MADFNKQFQIGKVTTEIQDIIDRKEPFTPNDLLTEIKAIETANDWHLMTGSEASFEPTAGTLDDTIFGGRGSWSSIQAGILSHTGSSNSLIKGYAGYETKVSYVESIFTTVKATFTELTKTGIGKTKRDGLGLTADDIYYEMASFDFPATGANYRTYTVVNGTVTSITDTGTPTDSALYAEGDHVVLNINQSGFFSSNSNLISFVNFLIPGFTANAKLAGNANIFNCIVSKLKEIGGAMTYNLTQTAESLNDTTFKKARENKGYMTYTPGLRTIGLEITGLYEQDNSDTLLMLLESRTPVVVEIRPQGKENNASFARGLFYITGLPQSGAVGQLEDQTFNFNLYVRSEGAGDVKLLDPFIWFINEDEIGSANRILINAYRNRKHIVFRYIETGDVSKSYKAGIAMITDFGLQGGLEDMNRFTVQLQGSDQPILVEDGNLVE